MLSIRTEDTVNGKTEIHWLVPDIETDGVEIIYPVPSDSASEYADRGRVHSGSSDTVHSSDSDDNQRPATHHDDERGRSDWDIRYNRSEEEPSWPTIGGATNARRRSKLDSMAAFLAEEQERGRERRRDVSDLPD